MKIRTIVIFLCVGLYAPVVLAQNYWDEPATTKFDQMEYIKVDIQKLIEENKILENTYAQLKNEPKGSDVGNISMPPSISKGEEREKLLELRLADLELQKRNLELKWQSLKISTGDQAHYDILGTSDLRRELEYLSQKEKELIQSTAQEQQVGMMSPSEVTAVEYDVKRLEEQARQIEKKVDFQKRENSILKDKISIGEKSTEGMLAEVLDEKKMYKTNLEMLEEQYYAMEDEVETALKRQKTQA